MSETLEFTGERFTPECVREIWLEHMHRYAWARRFARGRRVLDAACGEGYGSALLAGVAAEVLGVDIDPETVAHARQRYAGSAKLRFEAGDATALDALPAGGFDLVTSFETLEHVAEQERMLAGFARLLAPDGLLLVSSPDKAEYSDRRGFRNEFHVRELYRDELEALLGRHFEHVRLLGQKLLFQSALWDIGMGGQGHAQALVDDAGALRDGLAYPPMYYIALCSRAPLPDTAELHLFGDAAESVYAHYNHEVRKNMQAGARIAELEARIEQLERQAAVRRPWWRRLRARR